METIGFFAVAMTISFPIQIIPNILSSALFPITSELSVNKNGKSRQTYLIKLVFRYSLFFVLPVAIFLIMFSKYAILFFAKPEYLPATVVLPFLVLAQALFGLGCLFLTSLYALGKPNKYRDCFAIITLIYFLLAIPLTYYFSEKGLTVSYLFATLLSFILGFYILKKYLDIKLPINDIGKIIVAVFVSSIFLLLFKPIIYNFWLAGIFVATATLIYLLILLKLNFYLEEDLKVLNFVGDKSPIFKKQIIKLRNYLSKFVNRSYHDF